MAQTLQRKLISHTGVQWTYDLLSESVRAIHDLKNAQLNILSLLCERLAYIEQRFDVS